MSRRQADHDYNLRSMNNLMGERWKKVNDGGERSLIKAPSNASISSQGASTGASAAAGAPSAPSSSSTGDLERAARKQFQQDVTPGFVYILAIFSALGGFLFGYDTGVISGAMLLLKRELDLSALWQEVLISSTVAAAALSALLGGFLNGVFGRRVCILLASFFFAVGGIVLSSAPGKEVLLAGRLIVGLGLGRFQGRFQVFEIRGRKRGGWGLRNFNKKNSELRKFKKKCGGNGANKISVDTDINQFHSTK